MPLSDGSISVKDVKLTSDGMAGLVDAAKTAYANSAGVSDPDFSISDSSKNSTGDTLTATYKQNGPVTGSMKIEQIVAYSTTDSIMPVVINAATTQTKQGKDEVIGKEIETIDLVDATKLAKGQIFDVSLTDTSGTPHTDTITLTDGTLADVITQLSNSSLKDLATFETGADSHTIKMTYKAAGTVNTTIVMTQNISPQITPAVTVNTPGAAAVTAQEEKQTLDLGDASMLAKDQVFTISISKAGGGTPLTDTVTLAAGTTTDLLDKLNNSNLNTEVHFDIDNANNSKIVMTYLNKGAVSSLATLVQQSKKVSTTAPTLVRPDYIGPISITHSGSNLEVVGNPDGTPFNLNMRINGIVKASLPVGAQGSTSRNGLQVGQAKTVSYSGTNELLGVGGAQTTRFVAGTGLASTAATAIGTRAITPMSQTFFLNESLGENQMTFTVDGIVGSVSLPVRAYTGDTFAAAIQDRVNQIQDPKTGRIVSGVKVKFDPDNNRLVFTSGTTGPNSQINVVGHPNFGLGNVTQTPGSVPTITNLKQATDEQGNKLYVDSNGTITTQTPSSEQNWYPLYLTEGQLTFDTIGKLISPKEGVIYSPFDPQNGSDLLRLNIDYGKYSTQFSSPFSVLSLSQDGYPSGSLNGLDIDAGGTVRANYTNGQTVALGKVMIANFANPNGLKQVGNANYVATSTSGQVVLGQAGADGFGTVKAGALERSNVDITQELVNLITSQRNFQANAKAIETTEQLSQTIIQIRG